MEVRAKDIVIAITIETSPDELMELDDELNKIFKALDDDVDKYSKIWELKDKLTIALKG